MQVFKDTVTDETELRSLVGYPSKLVQNKVIDHIDAHCRNFLSKSTFLLIATSDANGHCDVSPKGDSPGFVHVIDDTHLLIPDRPGNRRIDSMTNIISNPHIGLIAIIPGMEETLRINGRACIVKDESLLASMTSNGHVPSLGIGVNVIECFVHCAKAFKRSGLWQVDTWTPSEDLPSAAEMLADHARIPGLEAKQVADEMKVSYSKRLY